MMVLPKDEFYIKYMGKQRPDAPTKIVVKNKKGLKIYDSQTHSMLWFVYFIPGTAIPLRTAFTASSVREEVPVLEIRLVT